MPNDEMIFQVIATVGLNEEREALGWEGYNLAGVSRSSDIDLYEMLKTYKGTTRLFERGLFMSMNAMSILGLSMGEAGGGMKLLREATLTTFGIISLYSAYRGVIKLLTMKEEMLASAEAAIYALLNPPVLGMAILAGASVYAGFQVGSGQWNFNLDYSQPRDRRRIVDALTEVKTW